MVNRRSFFQETIGALLVYPILQACKRTMHRIVVQLTGTKYILGHRLWSKDFPKPSIIEKAKIVIVGGGISGLSAARALHQKGVDDFILLELDAHIGGNASNGENQYSKYPRGAHYLPLPNAEDKELIRFLEEEKIIVGYNNGTPQFDAFQLSFPPQERLFYRGAWQEDLVPKSNTDTASMKEFERFFRMMNDFKVRKDTEEKFWFNLPIVEASRSEEVLLLDNYTMREWLEGNRFGAEELFWYIDYCCRDDYGLGIDLISAWAGIHYFSARKQNYAQQYKNDVLTWPEGNARLAHLLEKYSINKTQKNCIVFDVQAQMNDMVSLSVFDAKNNISKIIQAEKVIMATPQYINQYLLANRKKIASKFVYAPWIVAAITLNMNLDGDSFPLAWDNVIYGSQGLGYVYNQQQSIGQINDWKVVSYYLPFSDRDVVRSRQKLYRENEDYWKATIIKDLSTAHPTIENYIEAIEIFRLGHGMISPVKGFITSQEKMDAQKNIANKIFFAHTDLSGISVFEEGFHQGIRAVNEMLG